MNVVDLIAGNAERYGPLDLAAGRAELLIAIAHATRDRDVWGGERALTYWDRLPEKIRTACYAGPTLDHWWQRISTTFGCSQPRSDDDRAALAGALGGGDDGAVIAVLRTRTAAICLRVRLAHQARRAEQEKML